MLHVRQSKARMKLCRLLSPGLTASVRWTPICDTCVSLRLQVFVLFYSLVLSPRVNPAEVIKVPLHQYNLPDTGLVRGSDHDIRKRGVDPVPSKPGRLHGRPGQGYYVQMLIGTPPQQINVLVDTGSSNFAVASAPDPVLDTYFHRENSLTFEELGLTVNVPYTQGNWFGPLGQEVVRLPFLPNVLVTAQLACITRSEEFFINGSNWQGILGLAYAEIARPDHSVVPFFDSLVQTGHVQDVFSMQLCGTVDRGTDQDMGGTLIVGGTDSSLFESDILYTPISREWYYQVIITDVEVDGISLNMDCKEYNFDKTIVDSGTTNLRLPIKVYTALVTSIEKRINLMVGLPADFLLGAPVCWKENTVPYDSFPNLAISLAHRPDSMFKLVLSPQQYLRPVTVPDDTPDDEDCFKFAITSSDSGTVLGAVVMEAFYTVFNRKNKTIGFATSSCRIRDNSSFASSIEGPFPYKGNTTKCAYMKPIVDESTLTIVAYVMAGICGLCMLPLLVLIVQWQAKQWCRVCRRRQSKSDDDMQSLQGNMS